jgi:hypothetical protein
MRFPLRRRFDRTGKPTNPRVRRNAIAATPLIALLTAAGCTGGPLGRGHDSPSPRTGPVHAMNFKLSSSTRQVSVPVPARPVATAATSTNGVNLELYAVRRSGGAVDVVVALHNTTGQELNILHVTAGLQEVPTADPFTDASGISIIDTTGLKEYKTFREGGNTGKCLCSETWGGSGIDNAFKAGERRFYVAEVAAPPPSVTKVTVLAGISSVSDAPITG